LRQIEFANEEELKNNKVGLQKISTALILESTRLLKKKAGSICVNSFTLL
jgi:hypothetical protein